MSCYYCILFRMLKEKKKCKEEKGKLLIRIRGGLIRLRFYLISLFQPLIYTITTIIFAVFFYFDQIYMKTNMRYVFFIIFLLWLFATFFTFREWYQEQVLQQLLKCKKEGRKGIER